MTKKEYADYENRIAAWSENAQFPSLGYCPGCEECEKAGHTEECCEEHFSWRACEVCGSHLGGNRYPVHSVDANGDILHWDACTDCVYYLERGQLDDQTMLDMDKETE